jgi:hypothetical protein
MKTDEPKIILVCKRIGEERYFADDVEDVCARCGRGVFHRPHTPPGAEVVCMPCLGGIEAVVQRGMYATPETVAEVALYNAKPGGKA